MTNWVLAGLLMLAVILRMILAGYFYRRALRGYPPHMEGVWLVGSAIGGLLIVLGLRLLPWWVVLIAAFILGPFWVFLLSPFDWLAMRVANFGRKATDPSHRPD